MSSTITFYGGVHEIRGNKFLVEDKGTRIFLDFGMPMGKANRYFTEFLNPRICNGMGDLFAFEFMSIVVILRKDYNGAGAGTHFSGYKTKLKTFDDLLDEIDAHQSAGAEIMMIESEGITEDLPPEEWRIDVINELNKKFGFNCFMFEASDPPVFKWYLKQFGPSVNLFIDHSQIVEFTAWKTQLWRDLDIWKDKILSYKTLQ